MSAVAIQEITQRLVIEEPDVTLTLAITEEEVSVIEVGVQGPAGAPGASGDKHFEYTISGQTDLTVTHNLNKFPSITVIDSANDEVEGDYQYIDNNNVRLIFSAGFSGKAIFN